MSRSEVTAVLKNDRDRAERMTSSDELIRANLLIETLMHQASGEIAFISDEIISILFSISFIPAAYYFLYIWFLYNSYHEGPLAHLLFPEYKTCSRWDINL